MHIPKIACVVTLGACSALAAAACSSNAESASEPTTTTLAVETKGFSVQTPDGQVSLSLDGVLPPHWPADFPVAPHTKPAGSGSRGDTTETALVGVYTSTDEPADVYRFYASSDAYSVDSASNVGNGSLFVGTVGFSGSYSGNATVISRDDTTYVVVVLHTNGTSSTTEP
jgi:hypothetical protein